MEIQKIFTDTEGYERLYSVLLSEEELSLFSEIQKEFNSKAAKLLNSKYLAQKAKKFPASVSELRAREHRPLTVLGVADGSARTINHKINENALNNMRTDKSDSLRRMFR